MKICGVDFETTGLDTTKSRIVEVGAVLWDTELGGPVDILNLLLYHSSEPEMQDGAEKTHGLSWELLKRHGITSTDGLLQLKAMMVRADWACAHNGNNYDHPILQAEMLRHEMADVPLPWIDTSIDVPYPEKVTTRKLSYLAAEHNFLNPFPHRAVFDVLTMFAVMTRYPLDEIIRNASSATVTVRGVVAYEKRNLPKERRYRWDPEKKIWFKEIKEFNLEKEIAEAPFQVVELSRRGNSHVPNPQEPAMAGADGAP